jgi:hypothetical protein
MDNVSMNDFAMNRALPKQFLLTSREIDAPSGWTRTRFADRYLYKAPELPVTRIERSRADNPTAGSEFILGWFVYESEAYPNSHAGPIQTSESIERMYHRMTGRFIIISISHGQFRFLTDPGGLLPVVYRTSEGDVGSTPRALELAAPIVIDEEKREGFIRQDGTVWYAFGITPFASIDHLLPATVLQMPAGKTTPIAGETEAMSSAQSVEYLYEHSRNFISALSGLGTLECHLTAGWDSRMVMSAAMRTSAPVNYITYKTPGSSGSIDCQISRLIAQKFSLNHDEIALQPTGQSDIDDWRWRTADCIQDSVMHLTRTVQATDSNRFVLCGLAGEVGRAFYWRSKDIGKTGLTAPELLRRIGFKETQQAIDHGERWLEPFAGFPTPLILDQAYIDLRLGGWGGPSIYGHPVSKPTLTPFNNATMFSLMTSLPENYRLSGQFARDFVSLGSLELAAMPVNRAQGLNRLRFLKKEIIAHLPAGTKTAFKTLLAR